MRLDVRRVEALKQNGEFIGNRTRVKVVKNKVAPPFKEAEFDILYGQGISRDGEVLDLAVKLDIVQKSGAWFSYNEMRLGQGRDNSKEYLRSHPDLMEEITKKVHDNVMRLNEERTAKNIAARTSAQPASEAAAPAGKTAKSARAKISGAMADIEVDG